MKHALVLRNRTTQAHEISLHYVRPLFSEMVSVRSSREVVEIMRNFLGSQSLDTKEYMWVMCLSRFNHVLSISTIGVGHLSGTSVGVSEFFQTAFLMHASSFVMVHNHPSGNCKPSRADLALTEKVDTIGKLINLPLLDHIILTSESYLSMADENIL